MKRFHVSVEETVTTELIVDCPDAETLEEWLDSEDLANAVSENLTIQAVEDREWGYEDVTGNTADREVDYVVKEGERHTIRKWKEEGS